MKTTLEALLAAEARQFLGYKTSVFGADAWEDHCTRRPETLFRPRQICPKAQADGTLPPSRFETDFEPNLVWRPSRAPQRPPEPQLARGTVSAAVRAHSRSLSKLGDVFPKALRTVVQATAPAKHVGVRPSRFWAGEVEFREPVKPAAKPLWPDGCPKSR